MKTFLLIISFIPALFSAAFAKNCDENNLGTKVKHAQFGPYTYKMTFDDNGDGMFQISRAEKVLVSEKGMHFYINQNPKCSTPVAGQSVTKKHTRELVVNELSGGAHCCFKTRIYALEGNVPLIQKFDFQNSEPVFIDIDNDGIPEIKVYDWTFAYWRTSFADSPATQVVLKFDGNQWRFSSELTKRLYEKVQVTDAQKQTVRQQFKSRDGRTPPLLWETMLKLIYGGRSNEAFEFLNDTWSTTQETKDDFLKGFKAQLVTSSYYNDLKKINSGL